MLGWAIFCLILALFFVFIVLFAISLLVNALRGRRPPM